MTARPWPKARTIVCVSAPDVPHGVGHNAVCVCLCQWCVRERAALGMPERASEHSFGLRETDAPAQFTLDLQEAA